MQFIRKGEVYNENLGSRSGSDDCILDDLLRFDDGTNLVNGRKICGKWGRTSIFLFSQVKALDRRIGK